jgi:hypothetical protein
MAICPAHPDVNESLHICVGTKQPVILKCHAGCSPERVLAALNLTLADICSPDGAPPPPQPAKPTTSPKDWSAIAAKFVAGFTPKAREVLGRTLALPESVFDLLPQIGAWPSKDRPDDGPGWTFPERDAKGNVVGISERHFKTGHKPRMAGGRMGLHIPDGWCERPGAVYLVEGPSDTLAMTAAYLPAIGRPSSKSSRDSLAYLAELLKPLPPSRPIVVFGENDRKDDGCWPGREGAESTAAYLKVQLKREILIAYPPHGVKDVRLWLTAHVAKGISWAQAGSDLVAAISPELPGRVPITLSTNEHEINTAVSKALSQDRDLFIRAGVLVRVVHNPAHRKHDCSFPPGPRISPMSAATLREHISRRVEFLAIRKGEASPVHPPDWCVSAVKDRGNWSSMRTLESVVDYPILRPNGTILTQPGYDAETDIYYHPVGEPPQISPDLTQESAKVAWGVLKEAVADFPFKMDATGRDIYQAAWLAGVLTPLARFAFRGPAPLFLVDGNVRGAGKGLLCDTIAIIVSGREFATTGFTPDDEEMRKRITAIAMEGDRLVLLDNITGNLAGSSLDRALTSTLWKDRILGHTEQVEAPLWATWYGTGNNVQVEGDTARRVCHIRIEHPDEHPEERCNFKHGNLRSWVVTNRPRLLGAALTILAAFAKAGMPAADVKPWGSYEGWSAVVRSAVCWLGLPDPGETRTNMRKQSDMTSAAMAILVANWETIDTAGTGLTAMQICSILFPKYGNAPTELVDVAAAIESILTRNTGPALGYKLRHFRRRTFGNRYLDQAGTHAGTVRWSVYDVATETIVKKGSKTGKAPAGGDGGDGGDVSVQRPGSSGTANNSPPEHMYTNSFPDHGTTSPPFTPSPPKDTKESFKTSPKRPNFDAFNEE